MSFGWELFCWAGFIRKQAEQFDNVIVACRTGHDLLYRDFATSIVHYDPEYEETDMWKNRGESNKLHRGAHLYYIGGLSNVTIIAHDTYRTQWWLSEHWSVRQNLISFGEDNNLTGYDVLMIVRDTTKCNTSFRNWPIQHAEYFVACIKDAGLSVACIGKKDSAAHIRDTVDCRNIPLDKLARIMVHSHVIVGPQSGPIHFGTLCLLPQVCWQTRPEHAIRTSEHWNPFKVPVITIPAHVSYWKQRKMWLPSIDKIINATLDIIRGKVNQ